jgi:hypothetical protein
MTTGVNPRLFRLFHFEAGYIEIKRDRSNFGLYFVTSFFRNLIRISNFIDCRFVSCQTILTRSYPAFPQVYVTNIQETLNRAEKEGARIVTPVSDFYYGIKLARFQDSWGNIWWLYEEGSEPEKKPIKENDNTDWHDKKPSLIYTSLMDAMRNLSLQKPD